jgi:RNA polymerase sigma-70 factor (ECF subfamily)
MHEERLNWLAQQLQRGDRAAFREMVASGTRRLVAIAYRYTMDWDVAQDLAQETWIKVYTEIAQFDGRRPFLPWLLRIHRNHCLSHLRRARREREHANRVRRSLEDSLRSPGARTWEADATGARATGVPRPFPTPWDDLREREFGRQLREAFQNLSPRQQEVFALVDIEQIDQRSAAGMLGMEYATVRTTLHFARRRLAQLMRRMEVTP